MKRIFVFWLSTICILSILATVGCSSTKNKLVGRWQASPNGQTVILILNSDNTGVLMSNSGSRSFSYTFDDSRTPYNFDFIQTDTAGKVVFRGLAILQFMDENRFQMLVGYQDTPRPRDFNDYEYGNQKITYSRINRN